MPIFVEIMFDKEDCRDFKGSIILTPFSFVDDDRDGAVEL